MGQMDRIAAGWTADHFDFTFAPDPGGRHTLPDGGPRPDGRDGMPPLAESDTVDPVDPDAPGHVAIVPAAPETEPPDIDLPDTAPQTPSSNDALTTADGPGAQVMGDGRGGPVEPEVIDEDAGTPPPPVDPPEPPPAPTENGRGSDLPGPPETTPPSPPPGPDPAEYGRTDGVPPDPPATPLTQYVSGAPDASGYNVQIDFAGTWTVDLQAAFIDAADWLSDIILADLPDGALNENVIDDIEIAATLEPIDGAGGILGSAGPTAWRSDSFLPALGEMTFDSADAAVLLDTGGWAAVVLHEMIHALGFGTMWSDMGLTSGSVAGGTMRFTGINATDTYLSEFPGIAAGDLFPASGVPVETDGGPGTAGGHWDEALFGTELMTGYLDDGAYTSLMTIAALEDMGYDTVFDDPYDSTDLYGPVPADPLIFA